jgi:hypothetical protein
MREWCSPESGNTCRLFMQSRSLWLVLYWASRFKNFIGCVPRMLTRTTNAQGSNPEYERMVLQSYTFQVADLTAGGQFI